MNEAKSVPQHWVQIESFDDPVEAMLLREMLTEQGIDAILVQDSSAKVFGLSAQKAAEVFVAPEKAAEARRLISDYFSGAAAGEEVTDSGS